MITGEVKIKVTGTQTAGGENDTTVSEAFGMCVKETEGYRLEYKEMPAEGMEVRNVITFASNQAVISKKGAIETEMVFIPEKSTGLDYKTPFGVIEMEIVCDSIAIHNENNSVEIVYTLYAGGNPVSDCKTLIEVVPA